jgi:deoxyribodipyrimidine photo-lyase
VAPLLESWPLLFRELLDSNTEGLRVLPVDHSVGPAATRGGSSTAKSAWRRFLTRRLEVYDEDRNQPELDATSGLSPYLHFGHIASHQVFADLMKREDWSMERVRPKADGSRGWWGVSESGEAFLDQLVTWRELGFNMCWSRPDYDTYSSLPDWARATLAEHAADRRPHVYSLEELEEGRTHDPLWNASQMQLVTEGRIHNYLRMLWGKKILEWSPSPQEALRIMIELNNKYALDGRDPNSYSGIFWCLGRYDRPWGPERPIFGKIRYMSSENTARKVGVKTFIETYAPKA